MSVRPREPEENVGKNLCCGSRGKEEWVRRGKQAWDWRGSGGGRCLSHRPQAVVGDTRLRTTPGTSWARAVPYEPHRPSPSAACGPALVALLRIAGHPAAEHAGRTPGTPHSVLGLPHLAGRALAPDHEMLGRGREQVQQEGFLGVVKLGFGTPPTSQWGKVVEVGVGVWALGRVRGARVLAQCQGQQECRPGRWAAATMGAAVSWGPGPSLGAHRSQGGPMQNRELLTGAGRSSTRG